MDQIDVRLMKFRDGGAKWGEKDKNTRKEEMSKCQFSVFGRIQDNSRENGEKKQTFRRVEQEQ